ncbi:MAG TPA: BamA/TamA family outer membrane protein [Catalimonadaceae bacterium]|nr:BamA/TamA family outer membrane protein [Catalimonadaceae bacterium]
MKIRFVHIVPILLMLAFMACTGLKHVPETEKIYTGAKIHGDKKDKVGGTKKVTNAAEELLRPKANTSILGIRFGLWWYHKTANKTSRINKWLYAKLAQEPVYLSKARPEQMVKALDATLYNHGFLDSYSQYETIVKNKTASIVYTLKLNRPYKISRIVFPDEKDELNLAIAATGKKTKLRPGMRYNLEKLQEERLRVLNELKEVGFYYLSETDLLFSADTNGANRTVRIRLRVKEDAAEQSLRKYRIAEVNVNADYQLGKDSLPEKRVIDSVNYYSEINYVHPKPIIQSVFFKNNRVYRRTDHSLTYSRLMGLGIYKFVNIRLVKVDSGSQPALTATVLLIPLPRKSLSVEVQGVSKSNNFIGPGINFSHRNRNAFKGAELLILGLRSSFETQLNGPYKGKFTYELNPKVELYVPRFISPVPIRTRSMYVPRTKFIFDYSYLNRVNYFTINSFKFSYGYKWKSGLAVDHDLGLLNLTYFNISKESSDFLNLIDSNPLLRRRFEKQLIAGISYSFFYNEQVYPEKRSPFYLNVNFESAGNSISGYKKWIQNQTPNSDNPLTIGAVNYSQYLKLDIDIRQYLFFGRKRDQTLAARFLAGWGHPLGNSATMPYIKQFFSGGAYSVRGFPAFSIGPGTYSPPDSLKSIFFLQQGGEIKLELNVEYRFPIFKMVKGALFADAGNTWLNNRNVLVPGGQFSKTFYKELAASMGLGIRADVQFFVLRLDLGVPFLKPWLPESKRLVFDQYDLSSSQWRRNNLILNLAFGYPF